MNPQFVVSPGDLERAVGLLKAVRSPGRIAGRLAGLGQSEMQAGIPAWAWMLLAFGGGVYVGVQHWDQINEKLGLR